MSPVSETLRRAQKLCQMPRLQSQSRNRDVLNAHTPEVAMPMTPATDAAFGPKHRGCSMVRVEAPKSRASVANGCPICGSACFCSIVRARAAPDGGSMLSPICPSGCRPLARESHTYGSGIPICQVFRVLIAPLARHPRHLCGHNPTNGFRAPKGG